MGILEDKQLCFSLWPCKLFFTSKSIVVLVLVSLISKSMSSVCTLYIYTHIQAFFLKMPQSCFSCFLQLSKLEALFSWYFICSHLNLPSCAPLRISSFIPVIGVITYLYDTNFSTFWGRSLMLIDKQIQNGVAFALSRSSLESYSC